MKFLFDKTEKFNLFGINIAITYGIKHIEPFKPYYKKEKSLKKIRKIIFIYIVFQYQYICLLILYIVLISF